MVSAYSFAWLKSDQSCHAISPMTDIVSNIDSNIIVTIISTSVKPRLDLHRLFCVDLIFITYCITLFALLYKYIGKKANFIQ